jgi:dihydroorotase
VRFNGGKITDISEHIPPGDALVVDVEGMIVAPGLIDFHTHVYDEMNLHSVAPADAGLRTGVSTLLDTGSAGAMNYGTFAKYVIPHAAENIYTLLNISQFGVQGHPEIPPFIGDLHDLQHLDPRPALRCIEQHPERIVGVKARLTADLADNREENERTALANALSVSRKTGLICYIHHIASGVPVGDVLKELRAGDVLTHFYHGRGDGGFAADGSPGRAMIEARDRGVLFDVGHGSGSFVWRIAEPACQGHDFWPDTISSDIHKFNLQTPVIDMPTTMSKFLYLGMKLEKVIQCVTSNPAAGMRQQHHLGLLAPGRSADITILQSVKGRHGLIDSEGVERIAKERLVPVCVFKNGKRFDCAVDYAPAVNVERRNTMSGMSQSA